MATTAATGQQPLILPPAGPTSFDPVEVAKIHALNDAERILDEYLGESWPVVLSHPEDPTTGESDPSMTALMFDPDPLDRDKVIDLIRDGLLYRAERNPA